MSSDEINSKVWQLLSKCKAGMLVSEDGDYLHARPMQLVQDGYDGKLWFFTRLSSETVHETKVNRRVCVTFENPDKDCYVSLSGESKISLDKDKINQLWGPFTDAWYKKGIDDPEVALLEIDVQRGEVWEVTKNNMVQLFEIARASVAEEMVEMGVNRKFG